MLVKLGGIMSVNTVPCIFTMFKPIQDCFIIKVYFPNLDWVGHENFFVRLDGLLNFYLHPKMGHRTYWQNL